jgi:hypothetical protein
MPKSSGTKRYTSKDPRDEDAHIINTIDQTGHLTHTLRASSGLRIDGPTLLLRGGLLLYGKIFRLANRGLRAPTARNVVAETDLSKFTNVQNGASGGNQSGRGKAVTPPKAV